jgi:hypothetical protein
VLAAFPSADKALTACLAAQRGMRARAAEVAAMPPPGADGHAPIALKVRMGRHADTTERRDAASIGCSFAKR